MTAEVVQFLTRLEGGRTKDAMIVREAFEEKAEELKNSHEHLSGFFIVVWDDEGYASSRFVTGDRFPLMPAIVKTEVAEIIATHTLFPEPAEVDAEA